MQSSIGMSLHALTKSAVRSRRAALEANTLSTTEQRERVATFHDVLQHAPTLSVLTIPDYSMPGLSPDAQLQLILQDSVLSADLLLDGLPDDDDEEEDEEEA